MTVKTKHIEIPFSGSLFWKRVKLEKIAENFLDKVINITESVKDRKDSDYIESAQNDLSDYYYGVMESIQDNALPFWWEDFFNVENELKSLVSQLIIYTNNINLIETQTPFEKLLEREILILKDIKNFFSEILTGKYDFVLMKENYLNHEKEYSKILMENGETSEESSALYSPVVRIFERINNINENISDSLGNITLGVAG
jgi:hypothetical protein